MVLNGVSKSYAMTGWRIGYAAGPEHIITAMENVQSQSTSNPTSISQVAAEAALNGDQGCITPMLDAFRQRHVFVVNELNKIAGVKCIMAGGAFYAFPMFVWRLPSCISAAQSKPPTMWHCPNICWNMPVWRWCPARPSAAKVIFVYRLPPRWKPQQGAGASC